MMAEDTGGARALERAFVGAAGSVLSPTLLYACHLYGEATMPVDVRIRAGLFLIAIIDLPLLALAGAMCVYGLLGLHTLRHFPAALRRPKAIAAALLLLVGVPASFYMVGRFVSTLVPR